MKRILRQRWFKLSVAICLGLFVVLLPCAVYFRIGSWRDPFIYYAMSRECHPVWRDLVGGRVCAGQDVEEVIAATQPSRVNRYGAYVELEYRNSSPGGINLTGIQILAKDGRLVRARAASCAWERIFFDNMSQGDEGEYLEAYAAR